MNRPSLPQIIKASLLLIVYVVLTSHFVFRVPRTVPAFESLEKYEVPNDAIGCYGHKGNDAYTKIKGKLNGKEMKTHDLDKNKCLNIFGITPLYIQYKTPPENYTIYVAEDDARLFGEGYLIYQIEANNEIIFSYEESSATYLSERNTFFKVSIIVMLALGVLIIVASINSIRKKRKVTPLT